MDDKEILDKSKISFELKKLYASLFSNKSSKTQADFSQILETVTLPKLTHDKMILCEGLLTKKELYDSMVIMADSKSQGNHSLTIEFYKFY